jgi:hypothetical protein
MSNYDVAEQLSMFGLKPTASLSRQPIGQVMIDIMELSEPPKSLLEKHIGRV